MCIINSNRDLSTKQLNRNVIDCTKELKTAMVKIKQTAIPLQINIIENGDKYEH